MSHSFFILMGLQSFNLYPSLRFNSLFICIFILLRNKLSIKFKSLFEETHQTGYMSAAPPEAGKLPLFMPGLTSSSAPF